MLEIKQEWSNKGYIQAEIARGKIPSRARDGRKAAKESAGYEYTRSVTLQKIERLPRWRATMKLGGFSFSVGIIWGFVASVAPFVYPQKRNTNCIRVIYNCGGYGTYTIRVYDQLGSLDRLLQIITAYSRLCRSVYIFICIHSIYSGIFRLSESFIGHVRIVYMVYSCI